MELICASSTLFTLQFVLCNSSDQSQQYYLVYIISQIQFRVA